MTDALQSFLDGRVIVKVGDITKEQVDAIVSAAHRAFTSGCWSKLAPAVRERTLLRQTARRTWRYAARAIFSAPGRPGCRRSAG